MEKVLTMRKKLTFEDLVDEATEHEALVLKYDKKKEAVGNGVQKKAVSFDLDSHSTVTSNKDYFSEGSSINSVLSDRVNEMRALKISSVEQRELIQQQQNLTAQHSMSIQQQQQGGGNNGYQQRNNYQQQQQSRAFSDSCYNCGEFGHMARVCTAPPRRQQGFNGNGIAGSSHGNTEGNEGNIGNMESSGKDLGRQ